MERISNLPNELPILPSRNLLVYPTAAAMMTVEHEATLRLLDAVRASQHRLLVITTQKSPDATPTRLSDLMRVGTIARLVQMQETAEGKREIVVLGLERAIIGEAVQEQPYFVAHIAPKADVDGQEQISDDERKEIISSFRKLIARSQKMPPREVAPHLEEKELREIVYTIAFFLQIEAEHGQQLLEFDSVAMKLASVKTYLKTASERFDQEWQEAYEHTQRQGPTANQLEIALDTLHTATTLQHTYKILSLQKSLLLKKEALDLLRTCIAQKRQQKASEHWIFLLSHDLEFLERASKQGLAATERYLTARFQMLQGQQMLFEAMKVLALLDSNDPQTLMQLADKQEAQPFSPETFMALHTLVEHMENPEQRGQIHAMLRFLEDVSTIGKEKAMIKHLDLLRPGLKDEIDQREEHTIKLLDEYLTSKSFDVAYQTLKQNQEALLSDMALQLLKWQIDKQYRLGAQRRATMLEVHLALFEDARDRGLEGAWQTFMEDMEDDDA
ncbi:MAG TPA: LON peptidase substrate-binding domain-containing protein [Ktedonosporobacter sp.]|nr:LON peptidase substrate-binding domain-containing protein [Ktedonosporobacter sp.]